MATPKGIKPDDIKIKNRRLTLKQRQFIKNYLENGGNGLQAVKDAGYNVKNDAVAGTVAYENINKPEIKREIEKQLNEAGLTQSQVLAWFKESITAGIGEKATNSDAIRGLENLAKLWNMYPDKKTTVEKRSISIDLSSKDDKELNKLLKAKLESLQEYID